MPTLDDLRATFADLERAAPDGVEPRSRPRRPNRLPVALAAAVVLAVVGAVLVLTRHDRAPTGHDLATAASTTPSAVTSTADLPAAAPWATRTFTVDPIAGTSVAYWYAGADHQIADVRVADGTTVATAIVYPAGSAAPTRPADATAVVVNGHRGFAGHLAPTRPGMTATSDGPPLYAVAWQYAPRSWAVVQQQPHAAASAVPGALRVARAVNPSPTRAVRVPVRVGYLPAGYRLVRVSGQDGADTPKPTLTTSALSFTAAHRTGFTIEIGIGVANIGNVSPTLRGTPVTIGGWHGRYEAPCGSVWLGRGSFSLSVSTEDYVDADACATAAGLPTRTELTRIVEALRFATRPADSTTWFTAAQAVPAR